MKAKTLAVALLCASVVYFFMFIFMTEFHHSAKWGYPLGIWSFAIIALALGIVLFMNNNNVDRGSK